MNRFLYSNLLVLTCAVMLMGSHGLVQMPEQVILSSPVLIAQEDAEEDTEQLDESETPDEADETQLDDADTPDEEDTGMEADMESPKAPSPPPEEEVDPLGGYTPEYDGSADYDY